MSFLDSFSSALPKEITLEYLKQFVPVGWWDEKPEWAAVSALCRCGKFDVQDYLKRYPDVEQTDIDPVLHFVRHGIKENRYFNCMQDTDFGGSKVNLAFTAFKNSEYEKALKLYEELGERIGAENFAANISICKTRLKNVVNKSIDPAINEKNKIVNIVFVLDNDYCMQTATALQSLKMHKRTKTKYKIFLILINVSHFNIKKLLQFLDINFEIEVVNYDIEKYSNIDLNNKKYMAATRAAICKFDICNILKVDKVIYLDGDIIVKEDLQELFNKDISCKFAGVVPDLPQVLYDKPIFSYGNKKRYFNTGVMLLNLKKMRDEKISDKLIDNKLSIENDLLVDQNAFNITFKDRISILNLTYNLTYLNLKRSIKKYKISDINDLFGTNYNSLDEILKQSKIIHFSSKDKPWKYFDSDLSDMWLYYFSQSPYGSINLKRISEKSKQYDIIYNNEYPIAVAANDEYSKYLSVLLISLKESCSCLLHVYIFNIGLSEKNKSKLKLIEDENLLITFVDIDSNKLDKMLYECGHYSKEMYLRLFIPEVLYHFDKVLYLDSDTICLKDIKYLFGINLMSNIIGACVNNQFQDASKMRYSKLGIAADRYINSGVLVINVKKFVRENLKQKIIDFIKNNKNLNCPDQDAINVIAKDYIKIINGKWNVQWHHDFIQKGTPEFDYEKYQDDLNHPYIIHYTSHIKPWNSKGKKGSKFFWDIAHKSPFWDELILLSP